MPDKVSDAAPALVKPSVPARTLSMAASWVVVMVASPVRVRVESARE
jgi:hypothetical protein